MEILNYLERVGIGEKIYHRADSLSGGEQQRVAIVRALFQKPDALLADEPVASVDPERARRVIQLLCKMAKEQGLTLVVSLHDIELAREYFPRLIGLKKGHIAFDQPTSNVKGQEVESLYAISN
jgi:phosphonate transport system ATP-binding protein